MLFFSRLFPLSLRDVPAATDVDADLPQRRRAFPISQSGSFDAISVLEDPRPLSNERQFQAFALLSWPFYQLKIPNVPNSRLQFVACTPRRVLLTAQSYDDQPVATLCSYEPRTNSWEKAHCARRNILSSAMALMDEFLYVAGGLSQDGGDDSALYLTSAQRLNLMTWEWQRLPNMANARAYPSGVRHMGKFYVIGGRNAGCLNNSAEIYSPVTNRWKSVATVVPGEAYDLTAASYNGHLLVLSWTGKTQQWAKLWVWGESEVGVLADIFSIPIPYEPKEMVALRRFGARLLMVGSEVWVLINDNDRVCQVDGIMGRPMFPVTPKVVHTAFVSLQGYVRAISFTAMPNGTFNPVIRLIPRVAKEEASDES